MLCRTGQNRLRLEVGAGSQRPILESHEDHALRLSATREIESIDLERRVDGGRFFMQQIVRHIVENDLGAALRRAGRRLDLYESDTLILVGQKSGRQSDEQQYDGDDQRR